jgi:hypothetical protein
MPNRLSVEHLPKKQKKSAQEDCVQTVACQTEALGLGVAAMGCPAIALVTVQTVIVKVTMSPAKMRRMCRRLQLRRWPTLLSTATTSLESPTSKFLTTLRCPPRFGQYIQSWVLGTLGSVGVIAATIIVIATAAQ